jgi:hypothetical protein
VRGPHQYDGGVSTGGAALDSNARSPLSPGTRVDVRNRYQGTWARGFEVAECTEDGYRIRRLSDGSVLGELFSSKEPTGLLVALTRRQPGLPRRTVSM